MKKNKQSSLSSFFAITTVEQNHTLNEGNDWGSKGLSLGPKNIYRPHLAFL